MDVHCGRSLDEMVLCGNLDPKDTNDQQTFPLGANESDIGGIVGRYLRVTFNGSTDFYGRVTIYQLQVSFIEAFVAFFLRVEQIFGVESP